MASCRSRSDVAAAPSPAPGLRTPAVAGDEVDPVTGACRRARRAAARHPSRRRAGARRRRVRRRCATVSRTSTTRRSRSGCQVRTTTCGCGRWPASRSLRTSSPPTYSRSESNSVPCPRTRTAARPSSSRSRASRLGRCLRESNGGSDPHRPRRPSSDRCRPARPSGPRLRTVTRSARRSPRRVGRSAVVERGAAPGASVERGAGCRCAPADGCQASRSSRAPRGAPVLVTSRVRRARRRRGGPGRPGGASSVQRGRGDGREPARRAPTQQHHQRAATATTVADRRAQHAPAPARAGPAAGRRHGASAGISGGPAPSRARVARTWPTATPSSSASGRSESRCASVRVGERLDVVGGDEVAAVQPGPGPAGASSAVAPRGQTPRLSDGDCAGGAGDVDDVGGDLGGDLDRGGRPPRPAARSPAPATGATPAAARSCGSKPGGVPAQHLRSRRRVGQGQRRP